MSTADDLQKIFTRLPQALVPEAAAGLNATIQLALSGDGGGDWLLNLADGKLTVDPGTSPEPDLTLGMDAADFVGLLKGEADPMALFMGGKIAVKGDYSLALQFQQLFNSGRAKNG
ncbi:MAG: hypothetical protein Kow0031_25840 [Anaerolineae bacterium]